MKLYRGVSKSLDYENSGELRPKGTKNEVHAKFNGEIEYDGKFTHGATEKNAVRAHQIKSGLYDGCFISTTHNEEMARFFATNEYTEDGWVYVIDESSLSDYSVVSEEFKDPSYPDEMEVSLRAQDNGNLPEEICIDKYEVDSNGEKVT